MTALTLADRKRSRHLLWLLLAAVLASAAAVLAVLGTRASVAPTVMDEEMYPGLAAAGPTATTIKIESPTVYVTLNKGADGKWVVADRSNYPANPDGVRALLLSISQLHLVERRTADPARQPALDLTTGKDGSGHAVTITAADGTVLAAVVAGKVQSRATGNTPGTLFVRRAGEDQTWLARGGIAIPASIGATLDKTLFTLDEARLKSIRVEQHGGKPYTLSRTAPDAKDFTLDAVPEGKIAQAPAVLSTPASAIGGLTFDDVLKADAVKMTDESVATFTTFDGLTVKVTTAPGEGDSALAVIEASAAADAKPEQTAEAVAINARTGGWAYKLPSYVVSNLVPPLDSLVTDKPKPADPALPDEGTGNPEGATPAPEAPPAPPQ